MNYEDDMHIQEDELEQEWLEQAERAIKYGKHWARCAKKLTLAEENVKLVRSELIKEANEDPDKHLGEGIKPTAPVVEAYYRNHPRHKKAKEAWVKAQFKANVAEIAKNEMSFTRKAALENLVKLHGQEYFAGPSVPRDIVEERKARRKKTQSKVGDNLRRTKT